MSTNKIKQDIVEKYDQEAVERDQDNWYDKGTTARVPESKSSHYFIDRKVDEAMKFCSLYRADRRVMEIGCSFGHMTSLLSTKFDALTAVDISPKSVEIAEKRLKKYGVNNVNFVCDDAETLGNFADNSFEIIFSFSTIRFCPNPKKALESIYSKLDDNGMMIVDFPNHFSPWHMLIKPLLVGRHIHDNLYTETTVKQMVEEAGFKNVETKTFLFTTKRLPDFLLPIAKLIDFTFERLPFVKKLGGIIMVRGYKL